MSDRTTLGIPVFSVAFAVAYLLATELNWALVTYHPIAGTWALGVEAARAPRQPAMYWYGWLLTAFFAGAVSAAIAVALPRDRASRLVPGWVWPRLVWGVPMVCMVLFLVMLRGYFLR